MRRGTREACFSCLSHTPLSFFPTTYRVFYLCLSCVLGYGWKRLDFDTYPVYAAGIASLEVRDAKSEEDPKNQDCQNQACPRDPPKSV